MRKKWIAAIGLVAMNVMLVLVLQSSQAHAQFSGPILSFRDLLPQLRTPNDIAQFIWRNFQYESDRAQFGKDDYWQSPEEILQTRKGDCEDFALFAHQILKEQGVPSFILSIYGRHYAHTVCLFKTKEGTFSAIDGSKLVSTNTSELEKAIDTIYPFWDKAAIVAPHPISKRGLMLKKFAKSVKAHLSISLST